MSSVKGPLVPAEILLDALAESTPDMIYAIDRDGRYTFVSRAGATVLGLTPDQILGHTWADLGLPPEREAEFVEERERVMRTGEAVRREVQFDVPGGNRVFEYVISPTFDGQRNAVGIMLVSRDITSRALTEKALRDSEQRYRDSGQILERQNQMLQTLLDLSHTLSAELDLEKLVQSVTDACTQLSGAQFGAFFYNVIDAKGESYTLYTISGVPREKFSRFPMPRNTAVFAPTFAGTGVLRSDDIRKDSRYGKNPPYHGMPAGHLPVVSYLAVPVISKSGEVLGGLFFGHEEPNRFSADVERVVAGIAAQAAVGIDNARLLVAARRASEESRTNEERYRTLVTATAQIVWSATATGEFATDVPAWREVTGQTVEEIRGLGWAEAIHPADRDTVLQLWQMSVESGQPFEPEYRIRLKDGSYRWFAVRGYPLREADGRIREWIGTASDIDDKRRTAESSSFLADASVLLASSLDANTILTRLAELAVPRIADWCAIDIAQPGAPYVRLVVAHPDRDKAQLVRDIDREFRASPEINPVDLVLQSGKLQLLEVVSPEYVQSLLPDERYREIVRGLDLQSAVIVPIFAGNRVIGAISMAHAESGRRFSERDLPLIEDLARRAGVAVYNAQLYGDAQAANRAKDEFLATLSHELRTPMTSILGWARLLQMGAIDPATQHDAVRAIEKSSQVQAQLIDDILDVSRITLGKLHLDIDNIDLIDVVRGAMDSVRPAANAKEIRITTTFETHGKLVAGDPSRLQQVVWNLVSNAVKFTPRRGEVRITVDRVRSQMRIQVTDNGEGIGADFLPHIFERFSQADSTSTRRFGGLGLGLAIVRQITELHGGSVSAASAGIGQGATFTVLLPIKAVELPQPQRRDQSAGRQSSGNELPDLSGIDVLVVDDEPGARQYISAVLERANARVRVASTASEALAFIRQAPPRVLLSDIAMPDRDGYALIEEARKLLRISPERMPAIALSAFGRTEDRVRILAAGFQLYLMKPVDPVELARAVASVATGD